MDCWHLKHKTTCQLSPKGYRQEQQLLHLFNGLFSRTTRASWYQKGKTSLDLNEERNDRDLDAVDHMQTTCTLLQTDHHTKTPSFINHFQEQVEE